MFLFYQEKRKDKLGQKAFIVRVLTKLRGKSKPQGSVPATGLHPLVSETASPGFRMPAFVGTQPADVPYAGTVVRFGFAEECAFWEEIK